MKKHLQLILFILIAIFSCDDKPAYEIEGWKENDYQPNTIELSKATVDGNPIILSKEELLKIAGNPIEIRDSCVQMPIRNNQGMAIYECWIYDTAWNKVYQIYNDIAFLSHYNFDKSNSEVITPQINLSSRTKFKEIRRKFPNSYAHRNFGANFIRHEGFSWVNLIDDIASDHKLYPSQIELRFKDGTLNNMVYKWQPNYTAEQLDRYRQEMKIYN